jgi:hypothetical protein
MKKWIFSRSDRRRGWFLTGKHYLLHDRDPLLTGCVPRRPRHSGCEVPRLPVSASEQLRPASAWAVLAVDGALSSALLTQAPSAMQ